MNKSLSFDEKNFKKIVKDIIYATGILNDFQNGQFLLNHEDIIYK
jgi:hypothetical protein